LVAFASLIINWRFTAAFREMKKANRDVAAGRLEAAVSEMAGAASRVPESKDLHDASSLISGMYLLSSDKSAQALPYLREYQTAHPNDQITDLIVQAEIGVAFDQHDYDGFLAKSQELARRHAGEPGGTAMVASAYACKYAVTGDPAFKELSLRFLTQSKTEAAGNAPQLGDYEERIRYRLATREILNRNEHKKRFPNGWKGEAR
jgi:hypothetical protein